MILSDTSIRRPVLATVLSLLLVTFGAVSFTRLQVREFPDIDPPIVTIETNYTGASAAVVERRITQLIEDNISVVESIRSIESSSRDGTSVVTVEFDIDRDIDAAANDLREAISGLLESLPDEADPPEITKEDSATEVMMWLNLTSDYMTPLELADYAERYLADRFSVLPGVARVRVSGSTSYAMRVWVDRSALAARELTVTDVEDALRSQNVDLPAGTLHSLDRHFTVRVERGFLSEDDFRSLVVHRGEDGYLVRLGEVARITLGAEEPRRTFRGNGVPMVGMGIIKQSQANTLDVSRAAKAEAERVRAGLPEGMYLASSYDTSVFIEESLKQVAWTLAIAVLLVVAVIYLFLGSARATLVPAVTVPVSLVSSFIVLNALGFSVNLLTLLAIILAIGLVVDDAIVVLENVYHRLEGGENPLAAAFLGTRQVAFAVVATTLVLVAVFVPIGFLEGDLGKLFTEFAITLAVAVSFSSFVALTLSPMLASKLLTRATARGNPLTRFSDRLFRGAESAYRRMLGALLKLPWLAPLIIAGVLGVSWYLYKTLPSEFTPKEDRGAFFVITTAPEGASFGSIRDTMDEVEKKLLYLVENGEAIRVLVRAPRGFGNIADFNEGLTIVVLSDWGQRRSAWEIMDEVRERLSDVPGVTNFTIMRQGLTRGLQKPVQFVIGGPTYEVLAEWRDRLLEEARENPGLVGIDYDYKETKPQLRIEVDRNRAGDLGVSIGNIGRTLESLLGSRDVTTFIQEGEEYEVIVEGEYGQKRTPGDLTNIYVRSERTRELVPLANLVTVAEVADSGTLNRYNRVRAITVEANLAEGYRLSEALAFMEEAAGRVLPDEAIISYKGESLDYKESGRSAVFVFLLALLVVFLVLSAQFESFVQPLAIMLAVPVAVMGGLLGLWVMGSAQNIYTQIGSIMLIGLAAKNGILIVEFINQLRDRGRGFDEAVLEGSARRLRPIVMTGLTTVMGSVPLVLSTGAGSETRVIIGVVILFGVALSALFTLLVVPLSYQLIARRTGSPEDQVRRLEEALAESGGGTSHARGGGLPPLDPAVLLALFPRHPAMLPAQPQPIRPRRLACLLACAAALLGGCKLGPDYERPSVEAQLPASFDIPAGWKVADPRDDAPLGAWWGRFRDPQLDRLMGRAMVHNQNLAAAFHRVEQARAISRGARAAWFPGINFEPSAERVWRSGTTRSSGFELSGSTTTTLSLPFVFDYEIDLWGRLRRAIEAVEAETLESEAAFRHVRLTLQAELASQYFTLRALDADIAIFEDAVGLRGKALDLNQMRFDAGDADEVDLSRAATELSGTESELIALRQNRAEVENAIAVLAGVPSSGFRVAADPLDSTPPRVPAGVPTALLERRPDIAAAERLVMAENARIGVAEAAFFPAVRLTGFGGLESHDVSLLFDAASRMWGIGPEVSVPVFDGGRNRAELRRAEARHGEVVAAYRQAVLDAVREVDDALVALARLAERAEAQARTVASARRTVELSESRYGAGVVAYFEVVDAQRTALEADQIAVRIRAARFLATIALIKAMGGDWENP